MRSFTTSVLYSLQIYVFNNKYKNNDKFFTVFLIKKVETVTKCLYNMFINIFL